ncbi:hypothetical protein GGS20DRAFT_586972 [Poronia punctata]|nr:hypothetical protein GGS20DRAFT_586972 [Poronia punctata]
MGYDSSNPSSSTTTNTTIRPQMPSLSATAARGINRPPLTPKIASASRPSQPQPKTPSLTAATASVPKRTPQNQQQLRPSASVTSNTATSNRGLYDDSTIAFSPHLNSNITPRSGSRQSRVDSANSTPNGTPNTERLESWEYKASLPFSSPLSQGDMPKKPVVTFNAVSPERRSSRESKFFHASDIKPTARPTSASKSVPSKGPTFFYANGNDLAPDKSNKDAGVSPPRSPSVPQGQDNTIGRRPPPRSYQSGPTVSTTSKAPTVAVIPAFSAARSAVGPQRPASPTKPYKRYSGNGIAPQSTPATHAQVTPPPLGPSPAGLRRPGATTPRSSGHSRSGSLVQADGSLDGLRPLASPVPILPPAETFPPTGPAPLTLASIIQAAEEIEEQEITPLEDDEPGLQSPTKSAVSSTDPLTELIANARRERKVQDLQIRNASLEAINRTLERQLRKQAQELRRFRRLSRSGRLSVGSTFSTSELGSESLGLSDLGEEDPDLGIENDSLSDSDSASCDLSPGTLEEQDAKHRQKDEDRLNLDLSKHQQILADSQRINQSIKRCLDWTEDLIRDGKKALEYKVNASDVHLGGRVLDPLDEEEEYTKLAFVHEPITTDDNLEQSIESADALGPSAGWGTQAQDRDSGIELPGDCKSTNTNIPIEP